MATVPQRIQIPPGLLVRPLQAAKRAGVPAGQITNFLRGGYVPQPVQLPFHRAAREADRPDGPTQIAQGGGRGGAKSHGAVCQVVHDDCVRYPGLKWLYLRSVGASARESFEDMLGKALPGLMRYYMRARQALELPNGSRVILGGFRNERDVDKYVGLEYDGILIDDDHLISKAKYDRIRGSLRTAKRGWRPRVYVTFNPGGIGHAYLKHTFVLPWRAGQETDTRFFFSLPEDNVFLNREYLEYLNRLTGWLYKAWRLGDFDIAAGQFFTTWRHEVHVVRPPYTTNLDWTWWGCLDYGFTHPTVAYLLARDAGGNVHVVDEWWQRKALVPQNARGIKDMLARNNLSMEKLRTFVAGTDVFAQTGSSERSVAQQYKDEGLELRPANMDRIARAAEVLARLGDVDASPPIRPTLRIYERCARLIECLPSLEHDPHRPEDVLKVDVDEDGNGGDDPYDALGYGLMEYGKLVRRGVVAY